MTKSTKGKHIDEYCDEHLLDVDSRIKLFLDVLSAVAIRTATSSFTAISNPLLGALAGLPPLASRNRK